MRRKTDNPEKYSKPVSFIDHPLPMNRIEPYDPSIKVIVPDVPIYEKQGTKRMAPASANVSPRMDFPSLDPEMEDSKAKRVEGLEAMKKKMRMNELFHGEYDHTLERRLKRKVVELVFNFLDPSERASRGKLGKSKKGFTQHILENVPKDNFLKMKVTDFENLTVKDFAPPKVQNPMKRSSSTKKAKSKRHTSLTYLQEGPSMDLDKVEYLAQKKKINKTIGLLLRKYNPH